MTCTLHNAIGVYNNSNDDLEIIALGVTMMRSEAGSIPLGDDLTGR